MVGTRGLLSRVAAPLACAGVAAVLAGCSQSDLLTTLNTDQPQDPKASQPCNSDRLAKRYVMAASDSTVSEIGPYAGKASVILDGRPDDQYVALCLLDIPDAELAAGGLPSGTGPLTLAVLTDGGSP
jgi:hypothetical protein